MSRTRERQRRRNSRRKRAIVVSIATVVVASVVTFGALAATGVLPLGHSVSAEQVGTTPATGTPTLPAPSFSATPSPTPSTQAADATAAPSAPPVAPTEPPAPPAPASFDRSANSVDDPLSPWVVVNKLRPIQDGADYGPPDLVDLPGDIPNPNGYQLRADAAAALVDMFHAAHDEAGLHLVAQSGYRSYSVQVRAYDYYVNSLGVAGADLTSARPGFSEHQTGMAMDILDTDSGCSTDGRCFAATPAYAWLQQNAYRFGYVLRYPDGGTPVTGYEFEPWHWRWVGVPLATELHTTGIPTLEEFFGLPAAPSYAG
ncbi:M15 family metallopeptidase [Herbiconiux sp. P18]|uniref:M15 family metallopeptidase n=1 Tax=Herbiconiux liangxiaofengii TaxID=3342795 RepID=UPI003CF5804A